MVTGALRSGKSSLCRILVNYSLKLGWRPMLVDLDLKNNEISAPGTIAVVTVDESLPNDDLIQNALCFFQGQTLPDATPDFFDKQVSEMATSVRAKLENDLKLFNDEHMIEG
jgi:polyribonucleotide 5'-hydroxyl-kinase